MSFNVRLFGYSGIIQVGQSHAQQYSGDAVFLNEEPCLWSQILVCDGSTVVTSARIITVPDGTQMVCVEVPDGHEIRYEVVQPGLAARVVSSDSRRGSGSFNLAWSPGYTLSIIDAAPVVVPVPVPVAETWNPADKSASMVLSNGNKTATSTAGGPNGVRSLGSHTTGKWYVEIATGIFNGNVFDEDGLGLTTGAQGLTALPSGASFWARSTDGLMSINGVSTTKSINTLQGSGPGTNTIQFAIDLDAKRIWARTTFNGPGWIGTAGVSDPVAGTNGFDISGVFGAGVAVFLCMGGDNSSTDVATINQVLSLAAPAGFVQW